MKRLVCLSLILVLALSLAACGGGDAETAERTKLVVGVTPVPHAEILEVVKGVLAEQDIDLEIKEFTDYVQPNLALDNGDLDANYFQHQPYLDSFNEEYELDLTYTVGVHFEPLGLYSRTISSLDEIQDGARIAVPNDTTNEARALLLLQDNGLFTLKEGVGLEATKLDIVDNPKNIEVVELEAAQIPVSLDDVDAAVINGNFAIDAGLNVEKDALVSEAKDSLAADTFANILAVRKGDESRPEIEALSEALTSPEVKEFIEQEYEGAVVPVF